MLNVIVFFLSSLLSSLISLLLLSSFWSFLICMLCCCCLPRLHWQIMEDQGGSEGAGEIILKVFYCTQRSRTVLSGK